MNITALIMAGGHGERFWPKSRKNLPKQFLSLTNDGKTMIQLTVERISPLVKLEDVYIATNQSYKALVLEQLPGLPEKNVLCEPVGRNTAPCIGLGAVYIQKKYQDALMLVLPSDHLIRYNDMFIETLKNACEVAEKESNLVTLGITPNYPETGYGYIKFNSGAKIGQAYQVEQFVEKPDLKRAEEYIESRAYLWNSGMFVWKISSILWNMQEFMPDMYKALMHIQEAISTEKEDFVLNREFEAMEAQSIDYGIMEKADNIYILPGNFGWDDVGSWLAVERIKGTDAAGNILDGNVIAVNTSHSIIQAGEKLIAAVGLDHIIIVDTIDATLICSKTHTDEIKKVLEELKQNKKEKYI